MASSTAVKPIGSDMRDRFARDGVVVLREILDRETMDLALAVYDWSLANPGPYSNHYESAQGRFYQDVCNPNAPVHYRQLGQSEVLAHICRSIFSGPDAWLMFEQVFLKEGSGSRRTPWHQDSPYMAAEGADLAVLWIPFDGLDVSDSLEFVRGSHRGPMYNGSSFDIKDDTDPAFPTATLPRLPDIEADRGAWDIVSWAMQPGDVLAFHPATIHGGAPLRVGSRRRTLTLRVCGEDARYASRPWALSEHDGETVNMAVPLYPEFHQALEDGESLSKWQFQRIGA